MKFIIILIVCLFLSWFSHKILPDYLFVMGAFTVVLSLLIVGCMENKL